MASNSKDERKAIFKNYPSSKIPDLAGMVLDKGRLCLVEFLGQGSWGTVYKATRTDAGVGYYSSEHYAVKCLAPLLMSSRQRKVVDNEIKMHYACSRTSASILQLRNAFEDEDTGLIFIVTELCEGGTLLDRIRDESVVGNDECIRQTFLQILDAVGGCHNAGIYHRDLKLENILFKADGSVVLADFGFATYKQKTRDFGLGSREYMSPEVLGGFADPVRSVYSAQSDVWALGTILMALVTGKMPWREATKHDRRFVHYISDDADYIYHTFGVSAECNELLKSVFCHPRGRATVAELRKWVATAKSFRRDPKLDYLTEEPEKSVFECESDTDSEAPTPLHKPQKDEAAPLRVVNGPIPEDAEADIAVDQDIINAFPIPQQRLEDKEVAPAIAESEIISPIAIRVVEPAEDEANATEGVFVVGVPSRSSSGDADSEGPITPETHAVDNAAIVIASASAKPLEEVTELNLAAVPPLPAPAAPAAEQNKDFAPPGLHVPKWHDDALALAGEQRLPIPQR